MCHENRWDYSPQKRTALSNISLNEGRKGLAESNSKLEDFANKT